MEILVAGFGSIGKRQTANILGLGIKPYVLTKHPDTEMSARFVSDIEELKGIDTITHAVICSATARHLEDFVRLADMGIKHFLIEKPLEKDVRRAAEISDIAGERNLDVYVGYNMRFLPVFEVIRDFVEEHLSTIRLVDITAGQYLPLWRAGRDYRDCYSAREQDGGGVDLDLSHEIDYMLWIFGQPQYKKILKTKTSSLQINSCDVFFGLYQYFSRNKSFIVNVELDYIKRQRERHIRIDCENGNSLYCDFVNKKLIMTLDGDNRKEFCDERLFDLDQSYIEQIKEFLGQDSRGKGNLADMEGAIRVLQMLEED
jgi:predicted dehydrogenase